MGGITTGVGIFSGIDSASLIDQLIFSQSTPKFLAERRLVQLQTQQAALLDINSRLNSFKTAAASFRVDKVFQSNLASSSNEDVLTATAGNNAIAGNYQFLVDRLVTSQQLLSRGFADSDSSAIGLDQITFESADARLDRDVSLADFNNGNGVQRGKIVVNGTEVDLSKVGTVGELLDEINNSGSGATASVSNGGIVLSGVTSVADGTGSDVLESLGLDGSIVGDTLTGSTVYGLDTNTALSAFNDGRGVGTRQASGLGITDFNIVLDPGGAATTIGIRIGEIEETVDGELTVTEGAASTAGQVVDRINEALADAGETGVTASINAASGRIEIRDGAGRDIDINNITIGDTTTTTATDLGLEGSYTGGVVDGQRVLAGLNSTLVSSLNGGSGIAGDGLLSFDTADGTSFGVDVSGATTLDEVLDLINANGAVTASLNAVGNGLQIKDNTSGANSLVIAGTGGNDSATSLGIAGTFADGVSAGTNLQLAYIGNATRLDSLNGGEGIGTGEFSITDGNSITATITISSADKTLGDVIRKINDAEPELNVQARINDTGDGIIIEEIGTDGANAIQITDTGGSVARKLKIAGEASGAGDDNFIDGSFEQTIEFDPSATLNDIVSAINNADPSVGATIINDGSSANPFRISFVSDRSGTDGRFLVDTGDFDLGLTQLDEGNDARVFFGSSDPASGILITSSTNTLDGVVDGVTIDLKQTDDSPVSLAVTTNSEAIEEKITALVDAFNTVIERIDFQTRYNDETKERGPLLGDGTAIALRDRLYSSLRVSNDGFTDTVNTLAEVGLTIGDGAKLTFDAETFREAYANDPGAVEALFVRRDIAAADNDPDGDGIEISDPDAETQFSALGVIVQLEELADGYVSTINGTLQNKNSAFDRQIEVQRDRIASIEQTLENRREILGRQFLAMEQAIASFQSQGSALSQIQLIG